MVCAGCASVAHAQTPASLPTAPSAMLKETVVGFPSGIVIEHATPGALPLSLDEVIQRGLQRNLQILNAQQQERYVHGQILTVGNALLPDLKATAYTNRQEINLAGLGFKPALLTKFGFPLGTFNEIIKVDVTDAELDLKQALFNVPAYYLYRAAEKAAAVASYNTLNSRGAVVQAVANQYLAALADQAQIANAQALVTADEEVLRQARLSHDAGVGTNVDVLRAQVQLQTQQQVLVRDQNTFAKDKIALTRLLGLPADQEITLTDTVPYAEFAELPLDQAKTLAYERRKDLLALQSQLEVAQQSRKAVAFEQVPTVAFNGSYGVIGITNGSYHGDFTAVGTLRIPIFEEGRFRGEREIAAAQQIGLSRQIASLKVTIEQQIRASMLDVNSSKQLVEVARSNVDLATQELSDARDRFSAGVDDNLPVVQAQATLQNAQSRLILNEFQYNQAKLQLARNTGVVETQYKGYLGR
jgi:outer membrane protein TolC